MLRSVALGLERYGITYWIDEAGIGPGDDLLTKIDQAIRDARKFCCFVTINSVGKRWVKYELAEALRRDDQSDTRLIVPVLLHECPIPESLQRRFFIDLRNWDSYALGLQQLAHAIKGPLRDLPQDFRFDHLDEENLPDDFLVSLPPDQAAIELRLRYDRWSSRKLSTLRNYCRLTLFQIINYCEQAPHIVPAPIFNSIGEICYGVRWRVQEDYGDDTNYEQNLRRFLALLKAHPENNRYPPDVMAYFYSFYT